MYSLDYLQNNVNNTTTEFYGKWVPARPISLFSIKRIKDAWAVLLGRADAFEWPEDYLVREEINKLLTPTGGKQ